MRKSTRVPRDQIKVNVGGGSRRRGDTECKIPQAAEKPPSEVICCQATFNKYGNFRKDGKLRVRVKLHLLEAAKLFSPDGYAFCRTCGHQQSCATIKGAHQ